jgi:hypothetical protein
MTASVYNNQNSTFHSPDPKSERNNRNDNTYTMNLNSSPDMADHNQNPFDYPSITKI